MRQLTDCIDFLPHENAMPTYLLYYCVQYTCIIIIYIAQGNHFGGSQNSADSYKLRHLCSFCCWENTNSSITWLYYQPNWTPLTISIYTPWFLELQLEKQGVKNYEMTLCSLKFYNSLNDGIMKILQNAYEKCFFALLGTRKMKKKIRQNIISDSYAIIP